MDSAGDETRGFRVWTDAPRRILHIHTWGYWDLDLAEKYSATLRAHFGRLHGGGPWYVLGDTRKLVPQNPEVQAIFADLMAAAASMGVHRVATMIESTVTKMQIRRLARDGGLTEMGFFDVESEAIAWLLG